MPPFFVGGVWVCKGCTCGNFSGDAISFEEDAPAEVLSSEEDSAAVAVEVGMDVAVLLSHTPEVWFLRALFQ